MDNLYGGVARATHDHGDHGGHHHDDENPYWTGTPLGTERPNPNVPETPPPGLSDAEMRVEDVVAQDDRVAVRLTSSATHSGTFMGIPATGRRYEIGEIHWFRIADGRIAEHWHQADFLGMMRQLGAMPGGGGAMAGAGGMPEAG